MGFVSSFLQRRQGQTSNLRHWTWHHHDSKAAYSDNDPGSSDGGTMISPRTLMWFGRMVNFLHLMNVVPFCWNHRSQTLEVISSYRKRALFMVVAGETVAYGIFVIARFVIELKKRSRNYFELTLLFLFTMAYAYGSMVLLNLWVKKRQIAAVFNQMTRPRELIGIDLVNKGVRYPKAVPIVMLLYGYGCIWVVILVTTIFLFRPRRKHYIFSILPENYKNYIGLAILTGLELVSKLAYIGAICFFILYLEIYMCLMSFWITKLRTEPKFLRHQVYRFKKLYVLNQWMNCSMHKMMLPFIITMGSAYATLGLFGAFAFAPIMTIDSYMVYPMVSMYSMCFITILIISSSDIYRKAVDYKRYANGTASYTTALRKEIRSLQSFGLQLTPFGTICYPFVTAFYMTVTHCLVALLHSFTDVYQ